MPAIASLLALIVVVFFLNLFKQSARGPVVALMPDIIPGDYRSEANGVINTMGGIATYRRNGRAGPADGRQRGSADHRGDQGQTSLPPSPACWWS